MHISWQLDETLKDAAREKLMFPKESIESKKNANMSISVRNPYSGA